MNPAIRALGPTLVGTALAKLHDDKYIPKLQGDGAGHGSATAQVDDDRCGNGPRPPFPHALLGFELSAIHPSVAGRVAGGFMR